LVGFITCAGGCELVGGSIDGTTLGAGAESAGAGASLGTGGVGVGFSLMTGVCFIPLLYIKGEGQDWTNPLAYSQLPFPKGTGAPLGRVLYEGHQKYTPITRIKARSDQSFFISLMLPQKS